METAPLESPRPEAPADRYGTDFYTWTQEQAELLKAGRFDRVDLKNLIEEIETLGRSEAAALESAYRLIAMHQLKRMFQPKLAGKSWTRTIVRERLHAARILRDNPGLKSKRDELFEAAYADARKEAAAETHLALDVFPEKPPFTLADLADEGYWATPSTDAAPGDRQGKPKKRKAEAKKRPE